MSARTMAEVLAEHYPRYRWYGGLQEHLWECTSLHCDFWSETFEASMDHQAAALSAAGFGLVADAGAKALADLVANSPRLPSEVRNVVFEAVFDVVDKFNFPAQNAGTRPDVVEIGDVCGEVEKRIIAIIRAAAVRGES